MRVGWGKLRFGKGVKIFLNEPQRAQRAQSERCRREVCDRCLSGHTDGVWSVAISRDGSILVTGSWDKSVKLWDLRSGQLRGNLSGHSGYVTAVGISADAKTIVSAGWLGEIKIWKRS
ncbi:MULTISPECIES: hypothetical protein [unclassified Microcoleus]|uniref:WD40 repeat domain-containing protein n=1 Tax=unclassified Microcoleus TaxID=2642155 RepID=UPI002FD647E7